MILFQNIGCGRAPVDFWGSLRVMAGEMVRQLGTIACGSIQMDAWCGSEGSATTKTEIQGA